MIQVPEQLGDHGFRLRFLGSDGSVPVDLRRLTLQWRTNLPIGLDTNWQSITTGFSLTNGCIEFDDLNPAGPSRFYRVIQR